MVTKKLFVIIVFLTNVISSSTTESDDLKLELIQVLFRHGDRYPTKGEIERIGHDSFNKQFENFDDLEQLTKVQSSSSQAANLKAASKGMLRVYKFGEMLRNRYDDFLGEFKYKEVVARSTEVDRAKMSLQLALAALYPPTEKTAWSDKIAWSPIPAVYDPADIDFLRISFRGPCMGNGEILANGENSSVILGKLAKYKELEKKIAENTNIKVLTAEAGFAYSSYLEVMESMDHPLPEYLTEEDINNLSEVAGLFFEAMTLTVEGRRGIVGPTVERMLKNIEKNQEKKRKIVLYSSHDSNVATFVKAHNFTGVPPSTNFGSAVLVEQHRGVEDKIYIKMYYWTGVSEELIPLKLENCNDPCLLSKYTEIVKPMIPNEEQKYCYSLEKYCDENV